MTMSYESFRYAIEVFFEMLAGILASAVIAVSLDMKWETAVFLTVFWILRSYAGGIHLSKFRYCFLFSATVIIISMLLVKHFLPSFIVSHIMMFGGIVAFLNTEPENDRNRRVESDEDRYFRRRLAQALTVIIVVYMVCAFLGNARYMFILALSVDIVYVLMILGKIKNRIQKID